VASAVAPDGLVEGLESGDGSYLVAVQWHPEVLADNCPRTRQLFESFVDASSAFREQRALTSAV
jgi:putative glutamine amidotransferase